MKNARMVQGLKLGSSSTWRTSAGVSGAVDSGRLVKLTSNDIQRGSDDFALTKVIFSFDIVDVVGSALGDLGNTKLVCTLHIRTIFLIPVLLGGSLAIGRKRVHRKTTVVSIDTRKSRPFGSHFDGYSALRKLGIRRNGR